MISKRFTEEFKLEAIIESLISITCCSTNMEVFFIKDNFEQEGCTELIILHTN